jgi:DNA-binding beta-propeller fold protein YncE
MPNEQMPKRRRVMRKTTRMARVKMILAGGLTMVCLAVWMQALTSRDRAAASGSLSQTFEAPAGDLPATRHILIDGHDAAVLPNGRLVTPAGVEVSVEAPKPYGLALSPDGRTLATVNSGAGPFSVTLIRNLEAATPSATRIDVNATFMGIAFSADGSRFFASGGENGNIWVGDTASAKIVGSINLNGSTHPLPSPLTVTANPPGRFKGTFPGNVTPGRDGRYMYVVDQGSFDVFVVDTTKIATGVNGAGQVLEPNNFAAVVGRAKAGRYPYAIETSPDGTTLLVGNIGIFQYTHLRPATPTGNPNRDYPLGYPAVGFPEETRYDRTIKIKKVDPRNLPDTLRDPEGIRVGYIDQEEIDYTVPGLGSPNAPESSSVYVFRLARSTGLPALSKIVKTGPRIGEVEQGIATFGGSHPNAIAVGPDAVYVSNGNNDSISILDRHAYRELDRVSLSVLDGFDSRLKGVQPVGVAVSPDGRYLYVAEAGINAIAVLRLDEGDARVIGHIPTGWWPSSVRVSLDGRTLYVANSKGRGAGPFNDVPPDNIGTPKASTIGSVSIIRVPDRAQLRAYTRQVLINNGFLPRESEWSAAKRRSFGIYNRLPIKHVVFINKENSTYDQLLGDIVVTRQGAPVNGEPRFSLGYDASPNHHELALNFAFSDNFYLEPAVSSDGHRWLTNTYTTEFEETHWPASYGGQRRDAGDDPNVFGPYPGRLGFTDANGSPDPEDYNQHGSIYLHLARNGKSFVNFGNGYEFAQVDEDGDTEPTGIRQHVNIPMEKVLRDNSDHLYPEYNTHIPDAPLPEDPTRFSRFGRFQQVFEAHYVDREKHVCRLPAYVDLYYPNDHGGGANDINPNGPAWSYTRFIQDNDAALGLTVELISNSPCWKDTLIVVVEDDPQNGLDHVDGYRSIFLAISPWVKREYLLKQHISLSSIFKTVNLILGIPPLNQYDAAATDLSEIFTTRPDFRPYRLAPVAYAKRVSPEWIAMSKAIDFSRPDNDEVKLRAAILRSEGLPRH